MRGAFLLILLVFASCSVEADTAPEALTPDQLVDHDKANGHTNADLLTLDKQIEEAAKQRADYIKRAQSLRWQAWRLETGSNDHFAEGRAALDKAGEFDALARQLDTKIEALLHQRRQILDKQ